MPDALSEEASDERSAEALVVDVRALERRIRHLEAALDAGQRRVEQQARFVAQISHDLRTPLNALVGMSTMLAGTPLDEEQRELVDMLATSSESMLHLINDLLDLSKIEAGALKLVPEPFDLRAVAESTFDMVAMSAAAKGLRLAFLAEPGMAERYVGDAMRIRQMLVNLMSNAIKFTDYGHVTVRAQVDRGAGSQLTSLVLTVEDTGIGLSEAELGRLFKPYAQASDKTAHSHGGTGLGLYIVRQLAEMMGGRVHASSVEGEGSTFGFTIPLAEAPGSRSTDTLKLAGSIVLVAGAHEAEREMTAQLLERVGIEVVRAATTQDAKSRIQHTKRLEAVLVSQDLVDTEGETAYHALRAEADQYALTTIELAPHGARTELEPSGLRLNTPLRRDALYRTLGDVLAPSTSQMTMEMHAHTPYAPLESASVPSAMHILLAEDNPINQKVTLRLLKSLGLGADVVENGLEAVNAVERSGYDVVLMDVMMPVMDGLEATRQIRQRLNALPSPPRIIAVTANAMAGDRERCLEAGMDDYIPKPLRLEALRTALDSITTTAAAPQPEPVSAGPISAGALRELLDSIGADDLEFFDSLVNDFITDATDLAQSLCSAADDGDISEARKAAHTLKSSALMFGAEALSHAARDAEHAARLDDLATLRTAVAPVQDLLSAVVSDLRTRQATGYPGIV
jgi:signal transduction histidine kinase/CheY-like chemotaxis protein/HPt (histidine-containing phosphotransfer) domain-containing protein